MRAGLLRETLVFKEPISEQSDSGAVKVVYNPVLTSRASRKKMSTVVNSDGVKALEKFVGHVVIFQVRYNPLINERQRVVWQGREYEITLLDWRREDNSYLVTLNKLNT